jgi:hypothetical protein
MFIGVVSLLTLKSDSMQSGPKRGIKKRDARRVIINALAENGPLNMWQAKQKTRLQYSSVHKAVTNALLEGSVSVLDEISSSKKIRTKIYGLTFKGTLIYLAQFDQKAVLDKQTSNKLLAFIKKQGDSLNYPLFQESPWLYERDELAVNFFVGEAVTQLQKPLKDEALTAKEFVEHLGDPEYFRQELGRSVNNKEILEFISIFRHGENQNLMFDFAEDYFICGLGLIKGTNPRLFELARDIRDWNQERMDCLNRAVDLFEDKSAANK